MLKSSWQARGLAKRIIIILIVSVLLLSAAACNRKGPPQSGILEDDYDLTIEGEVVFTICKSLRSRFRGDMIPLK